MREHARGWAGHLCHPLPLAAVALLAANDHLLKGSGLLPGAITGKLSDVAGLFFFPLLLSALVRAGRGLAGRGTSDGPAIAAGSALATFAVFTALKLWPAFNAVVERAWGRNALDATDLLCLPALAASWLWMRRPARPAKVVRPLRLSRPLQLASVIFAGVASIATSTPRPTQLVATPITLERDVGCAHVNATWLGLGVPGLSFSTRVDAATSPCAVELRTAELYIGTRVIPGTVSETLRAAPSIGKPSEGTIDFAVDLEQLAAEGNRAATVVLLFGPESNRASWDVTLPALKPK